MRKTSKIDWAAVAGMTLISTALHAFFAGFAAAVFMGWDFILITMLMAIAMLAMSALLASDFKNDPVTLWTVPLVPTMVITLCVLLPLAILLVGRVSWLIAGIPTFIIQLLFRDIPYIWVQAGFMILIVAGFIRLGMFLSAEPQSSNITLLVDSPHVRGGDLVVWRDDNRAEYCITAFVPRGDYDETVYTKLEEVPSFKFRADLLNYVGSEEFKQLHFPGHPAEYELLLEQLIASEGGSQP